jgi:hypothetical protein
MGLSSFLEKVPTINPQRDYWFIRTDGGKYYSTFLEHKFIAIGWNFITPAQIQKSIETVDGDSIKKSLVDASRIEEERRIIKEGGKLDKSRILDLDSQSGKVKASTTLNKLQTFYSLKRGDVIIIPNEGSHKLAFGIIVDSKIYEANPLDGCEYTKRRKVTWIKERSFWSLDMGFYNLKKSMHAISSIKQELHSHIDQVMYDIYFKEGYGHYVVRVQKEGDIPAHELIGLGSSLLELLQYVNRRANFREHPEEVTMKINIQSPGDYSLKGKIGKSIFALAFVANTIACGDSGNNHQNLGQFAPQTESDRKMMDAYKKRHDSLRLHLLDRELGNN